MIYHKIDSVFMRDPETKYRNFLMGEWSRPEFQYLANNIWRSTEKLDGTNVRLEYDGRRLTFEGRKENSQIPVKLVNYLNDAVTFADMQGVFGDAEVTVFAEGVGPGIQKCGAMYGDYQHIRVFDVVVGGFWLEECNVIDVAEKLGLEPVPVLSDMTLVDAVDVCRSGFASTAGDGPAEGLVLRPAVNLANRKGERIITKVKTKDFR